MDAPPEYRVDLYCSRKRVTRTHVHFEVINGCWDGQINPETGELLIKATGGISRNNRILNVSPPKNRSGNYNDAINWAREYLIENSPD